MFLSWLRPGRIERYRPQSVRRRRRVPLRVEALEDRRVPATFVVNTTDDVDDGVADAVHTSLREAIHASNATPLVFDTIAFNIPGAGPHVISPTSALPTITAPVDINGYSQPGASPNFHPISSNAVIKVMLHGGLITDGSSGLVITGGGSTVRGLAVGGFGYPDLGAAGSPEHVPVGGIVLLGPGGNTIAGNFIGTDPLGLGAKPNNFYGVFVASSNNRIGGSTPADRNVISGNQGFGIQITARDLPGGSLHTPAEFNHVAGNLIGTDRTGMNALANTGGGVMIRAFAKNNYIGGTAAMFRNVISGNGGPFTPYGDPGGPYQDWPDAPYAVSGGHGDGVHIENLALITPTLPVPNYVIGNYIGTNAPGTAAVPNRHRGVAFAFTNNVAILNNLISGNREDGIGFSGWGTIPTNNRIEYNRIGTDVGGAPLGNGGNGITIHQASANSVYRNTIAYNAAAGVIVVDNPPLGSAAAAVGNRISQNSIYSNGLLGIDLRRAGVAGVTLNDVGDADTGPNGLQNSPQINLAHFGALTHVTGVLNSLPNTSFTLEFFASPAPDPTGFGEGRRFLGAVTVTTNVFGTASFNAFLSGGSVAGEWVTATATDVVRGNTSEFSRVERFESNPFGNFDSPNKLVLLSADAPVGPEDEDMLDTLYWTAGSTLAGQKT